MNNWTNENQITLNNGTGAVITISPGESTPFLISRHYSNYLEERGSEQLILGFKVRTKLQVITGNPADLKEEDIRISPNYDKYSENRKNEDNTYDYGENIHIYGSENDTWGVLDYQDFSSNPYVGTLVKYSNIGEEDITIELTNVDLQVVTKSLVPYEGEDIIEMIEESIEVPITLSGTANAVVFTKSTKLIGLESGKTINSGGGSNWSNIQNFPSDGKAFYTIFNNSPQLSDWVIGRRKMAENIPLGAKIISLEVAIMNYKNLAKKDNIIDYQIYLVGAGSDNPIGGIPNLSKSGELPSYSLVKRWEKSGQWSKKYSSNDIPDRSYLYNNSKGIITPAMFNSSQMGFRFRVLRVGDSDKNPSLRIGHARMKCTYRVINKSNIVGMDSALFLNIFLDGDSEIEDNALVKCNNPVVCTVNKSPNIWQLIYSAFVNLSNNDICFNADKKVNISRILPFIGRVKFGCGLECVVTSSGKLTVEDKEIHNIYEGYETHGKAGQVKETKPLSILVNENKVKSLTAYTYWNNILPVNASPHLGVNNAFNSRGYVNLYSSEAVAKSNKKAKMDFDLRYITKELLPTFQMDYTDTTLNDIDSIMNINTLDTKKIINGFDFDSINLELVTDNDNNINFDITGDNYNDFYLKSESIEEEVANFSSIEQFKPNYSFKFVCNIEKQFDENNVTIFQNGILNYSLHGVNIAISCSDDPNNNIVTITTSTNIEEYELKGSMGSDITLEGEINENGRHEIIVYSETDRFQFNPYSLNKNTDSLHLNVNNYGLDEEFTPYGVRIKELKLDEFTISGVALSTKAHNVIVLPAQTKSYSDPDFYRDSEDGLLPCYVNPTSELFFKTMLNNFFAGSCIVKNKVGDIIEYKDYIIEEKDEITISNGVTKIIIKPRTDSIEYYAYNNGWKLGTTCYLVDKMFDIAFNYINPESIEVRIGTTFWRLDRGNFYFNIRHSHDDIKFDSFDKITYLNENGWLETVKSDTIDEIPIDKWFFVMMDNNNSDIGIMFMKNPPKTLQSNMLPADELTGIGWYQKNIPVDNKELPILGEFDEEGIQKTYKLFSEDNLTYFEHYTYRAMEWLNDKIQQVMLKLNFKE